MFAVPALVSILEPRRDVAILTERKAYSFTFSWFLVWLTFTFLIGLRVEVGGDWFAYLDYAERAQSQWFQEALQLSDPGYHVLNWLSVHAGFGVFGVNLVGGAIFMAGLASFSLTTPRPWLALAVAVPYLVIVVGMGYSRQAMALGFVLLGLVGLSKGSLLKFVFFVILGATAHKSAVLMLPIAALAGSKSRVVSALLVGVTVVAAYQIFLQDSVAMLYENYVVAQYQSQGALIRLLMNAVPACVLLLLWQRFDFNDEARSLWAWCSAISLLLLGLGLFTSATTAVDRVALYMLPMQMVVFSRIPDALGEKNRRNDGWVLLVVLYYAAVQLVWLNFAANSKHWVPYRLLPLEIL